MLFLPRFTSLESSLRSLCVPQLLKTVLWMTDERRAAALTSEPLVCWWSSSQIICYWSPNVVSQHVFSCSGRSNSIRRFVSEGASDANRPVCPLQGHCLRSVPVGLFSSRPKHVAWRAVKRMIYQETLRSQFGAVNHHNTPQTNTYWVLIRLVGCVCWDSFARLLYIHGDAAASVRRNCPTHF